MLRMVKFTICEWDENLGIQTPVKMILFEGKLGNGEFLKFGRIFGMIRGCGNCGFGKDWV